MDGPASFMNVRIVVLSAQRLFFDYATEYRLKNENILSAKDFKNWVQYYYTI